MTGDVGDMIGGLIVLALVTVLAGMIGYIIGHQCRECSEKRKGNFSRERQDAAERVCEAGMWLKKAQGWYEPPLTMTQREFVNRMDAWFKEVCK